MTRASPIAGEGAGRYFGDPGAEVTTTEQVLRRPVALKDIREAHQGLAGVAVRSPLVASGGLSAHAGVPISLKCEQFQPSGSFKTRGAFTAVRRQAADGCRGVITYSSGNHAQAVAFAAHRLGLRAVLVMPTTAPEIKVTGVKRWGGEVVLEGTTSEERRYRAEAIAGAERLTMIPPFDDPHVIAGQGTVGLEIVEQCPGLAHVLVPAGGGGLAAGVATALRGLAPAVHVIVVEPVGAPTVARAIDAGEPVTLTETASVADGLLPLRVGDLPFSILATAGVSCVQVTDDEIRAAAAWLYGAMGLAPEPSGAVTTAAVRSGRVEFCGPAVAVVSGGNVSTATLAEWQ